MKYASRVGLQKQTIPLSLERFILNRGGEPIYDRGAHELWSISGGQQEN